MGLSFPAHAFRREDETEDEGFYALPRLKVHLDDAAIESVRSLLRERVPPGARLLDLMSSWRSHLPAGVCFGEVVGLGMNAEEMGENGQLTSFVVHNLNQNPSLPFSDQSFDAAVCVVSVQYLVRPVEVFAEVGRVLRPGAPFIVVFSNRCFPTKAVRMWLSTDDAGHGRIVRKYFDASDRFESVEFLDRSPSPRRCGDPVYAVIGHRQ
ncbi:MAG: methyltransferase domain-containing protein [Planctomycetes bacterium]|nr:methyltransferase domain-containing protein [Planctomycetota bacterium]